MKQRLLAIALERETDIVLARQRTRDIADRIGFDRQDQTRITTAVSEIARNALDYGGGGRVEYWFAAEGARQSLEITIRDNGPGIADLGAILDGSYRSGTGLGLGITGAQRLMDDFAIDAAPGKGVRVRLVKHLPLRARALTGADLARVAATPAKELHLDPNLEIRLQNREMLVQLEELQKRQEELTQLNQELQDTNRGVVALYAELDERADHLRRADELKSRFLSNMSHEFRTPLNSILALSRLLLTRNDGELTPDQEKQIQFIRKGAETLSAIVNDLLDLAKVEAGKTVVAPAEFAVADLFGALRGMLRPLLVGEGLSLVFEDAAGLPPLKTDEGKVSQILRNFISNAIKFTERGEITVWAEAGPGADFVTFRVRDTGIGIAERDLAIIWQEFGQVAHPLQSRVKGTGLGLPLSRKLAELLGGSVAAESAPGEGSIFSLVVPRVYKSPADGDADEAEWRLEPGRLPVLVVEDDPADAFTSQRALSASRYQAIGARSVAQARRAMERFRPVAILLDLILVGEETWRFLIELKQNDATHAVPVIMVSSTQEERKARSLGADDYLGKPVAAEDLVAAIDRATGRHPITRVLVVDDDEVSRYLVRQLLPRGAYEIIEAATGQDALERAGWQPPDVALVDLNMPTMNGFEFVELWSMTPGVEGVPIVVLTALTLGAEQRRRLADCSSVLSKAELSADLLVDAIDAAMSAGAR